MLSFQADENLQEIDENKISNELQKQIIKTKDENIQTLITINDRDDLENIKTIIEKKGGKVKDYIKESKIIEVEIPSEEIKELTRHIGIKDLHPEQEFSIVTDIGVGSSIDQIRSHSFWSIDYTGKDIIIAILDTGISKKHEMLEGKVIAEKSFLEDKDPSDHNGHGTLSASIAAGKKIDDRASGVAPDALILNGKVLDAKGIGKTSNIIRGINWAIENKFSCQSCNKKCNR